jgi:hypothetical protein
MATDSSFCCPGFCCCSRRTLGFGVPDLVDLVVDLHQVAVVVLLDGALGVAALLQVAGAATALLHLAGARHQLRRVDAAPAEHGDQQVHEQPDDADPATADRDRATDAAAPAAAAVVDAGDVDVLVVELHGTACPQVARAG